MSRVSRRRRSAALYRAGRPRSHEPGSRIPKLVGGAFLAIFLVIALVVTAAGLTATAAVAVLSSDLPDVKALNAMTFAQPTVVYDRTGEVELAKFQREKRRVVTYEQVPRLVLDATTTAEDRTFWENGGFDPAAIAAAVAENANGTSERGASTITQQLVRARLLPDTVTSIGADRYLRKAKEVIQASRLTDAFPGEEGKERIVTAYLNEIFYGHDAYGIAAAAEIYFGVTDLSALTPAQAALLAGLPKSPSNLDPYRYAVPDAEGKLVVPSTSPPVVRRDWVLENLSTSRWTKLTKAELRRALAEPVILAGDRPLSYRAPHFTWQVRRQLEAILGDREPPETGGYTVITTLDWRAQSLAEKWLAASAIAPNLKSGDSKALLASLEIPKSDLAWINALRGRDLHNGSLVTLNYRNGDVLAYAGSAGYYRDDLAGPKFDPKYDAAGDGARQPGSAFKPIIYATAFDTHRLTPGSLLLDITTEFGKGWAPRDADQLDRGPVLVRRALQYSLNIPAIRALHRAGSEAVADRAEAFGIRFTGGREAFLQSGLAGAIGTVEVRPIDLTSAFGGIANWGFHVPPRMILEVRDAGGDVVWKAPEPEAKQVVSSQAAWLVTDILVGNTDPGQNPIWAEKLRLTNGPDGEYRPAAVKTGTANDARDLATYGYLPVPEDPNLPSYAVGIWMGNSDHSMPRHEDPATSLTAAAPLWRAYVRDLTAGMPIGQFVRPKGLDRAAIDAWSGGRPGGYTRETIEEWFIDGTAPGSDGAVDPSGLLYSRACGGWRVDPVKAELGPSSWDRDVADWLARARRGVGVEGRHDSRTAYFWGERSWGGSLAGTCYRPKPPSDDRDDKKDEDDQPKEKPPDDKKPPKPPPDGGGGDGDGGGDGAITVP